MNASNNGSRAYDEGKTKSSYLAELTFRLCALDDINFIIVYDGNELQNSSDEDDTDIEEGGVQPARGPAYSGKPLLSSVKRRL